MDGAGEAFHLADEDVAVMGGKDVDALLSAGGVRYALDLPALAHQVADNEGLNRGLRRAAALNGSAMAAATALWLVLEMVF